MIIDCHGHYTTAPREVTRFRESQLARLGNPALPVPELEHISDDAIRETIEANQLRVLHERGGDLIIFSPRASGMEHHVEDVPTATAWAQVSNDLIARVVDLFPSHFAGVCQLPQTPGGDLGPSVAELRRCVEGLGFVGCNLNPDPSGGYWTSPPLTDEAWFPIYEAMVELDVPAMIHVSGSCNPAFHTLGAHYLNADTSIFMQLIEGDLFARFPTLRLIIPHGGGAVPYHWGRYRGLSERLGKPPPEEHVMPNVFFDTAIYHQPGIDLLFRVVDADHVLFASEMLGAVRGINPDIDSEWDNTQRYLERAGLDDEDLNKVYEANALRVFPRLRARLEAADTGR
jgi:4-oxalmesaconate hydratase